MTSAYAESPVITVVRGNPTAEQVAALVGALLSTASPATPAAGSPRSAWWASGLPGRPRGWRESGLPR
ncbi:MAG: acyl-CoA carboxylase subunit epsilon [Hamadaea sp.]|uniref:acyl-CoA carboxylase subunit epsilon n=1 Tax=Hamadaea sp. NPDC050747 TaxID=3155789 RepID=UPI00179B5A5B|nr:acyl-CoA carboxylase subunit epsilon [Hamadaea sp.]NUR48225.1 acyl-CoA carboxylase subunit epsilon [Hamadaea sp.]NUT04668.1 acyl-CoA carboxylase subunit epsilon [Hamadaea sp.]